jgi:predicted methyltransferase
MTEKKERIYVGSGVEKFDGDLVNASVCLSDIKENASEHIFEYNGKKYIKLKVVKKQNTDEYGKTHYVEVDTWKPEAKKEEAVKQDDDLPF